MTQGLPAQYYIITMVSGFIIMDLVALLLCMYLGEVCRIQIMLYRVI